METEEMKYEVTVSVRLHGAFTVRAIDESCAEEIVNRMFAEGEIKLGDLEFADETRVDCTGEADKDSQAINEDDGEAEDAEDGEEPPKHICPNSQQPCDEDCSWAEKANCEYYQGLCAGRAESGK